MKCIVLNLLIITQEKKNTNHLKKYLKNYFFPEYIWSNEIKKIGKKIMIIILQKI